MCSVYEDVELLDWLRWAEENGQITAPIARFGAQSSPWVVLLHPNCTQILHHFGANSCFNAAASRVHRRLHFSIRVRLCIT